MKCSGAEIIVKLLEKQGIKIVAGIPGGANLPLYDALYKSNLRHVLARHEQGAGFIAQGMARSSGGAAVCFATSGPGATNLITAIADAHLDSVPLVAITGQVSSDLIGTDAFQEVDMYGLTLSIAKHNYLVRSAEELFHIIPEAFNIAASGRPGPVVIDVPKDIQTQQIEFLDWPSPEKADYGLPELDLNLVEKIAADINKAKRPLLYIGGGIIKAGAADLIRELANKNHIPIASTLMGLGSVPPDDPLYLGMLGMHGCRYTNYLLNESDLLLALGVRFDDRVTGNINKFCPHAAVIHIDIDPTEIGKIKKADISMTADVGSVLNNLLPLVQTDERLEWVAYIKEMKEKYPVPRHEHDQWHPCSIVRQIGKASSPDTIITTDVGQHQMWVAQAYPFQRPGNLLTSGGMGTMGFGLPAAIGAALANPDKKVICFSGDGSLLMNIQELATLADLQLNITIFLFNNGHLGLVKQQQQLFYNQNYMASKFITNPDFVMIAQGFGIKGTVLNKEREPEAVFKQILAENGPYLVDIPIDYAYNVFPMVPPGKAVDQMIDEH